MTKVILEARGNSAGSKHCINIFFRVGKNKFLCTWHDHSSESFNIEINTGFGLTKKYFPKSVCEHHE